MYSDDDYLEQMDFLYDENGRLIKAPILIDVCSPRSTEDSAVDPSTMRRYGLSCPMPYEDATGVTKRCNAVTFAEDGKGNLVCRRCGIELGTLATGETLQ
jgi:hypothetical protein